MSLKSKKSVDDIWPMAGKKVLVRVDFNVPIKGGVINDDYRIRSAIPTIKRITDQKGTCILMSHLGRPKGVKYSDVKNETNRSTEVPPGFEEEYSLRPVAARLQDLISRPIAFSKDCMNAESEISALKPGDIILLENVRFYSEEGSKKAEERLIMAEKLASYGDYFVSDAFGTAHRESATMTGIPKVLGHGAVGYLMEREINYFAKVLGNPPTPVVAIVGGAKVSDKILLLENMLQRINKLIIGGAMAYTFLKALGKNIGTSFSEAGKKFTTKDGKEQDIVALAEGLINKAKEKNVELFLPIDHLCHTKFENTDTPLTTEDANIPDGYMALDIGPKTVDLYTKEILKCKTAIWNGPMGVFEQPAFCTGTFAIAKAMADATEKDGLLSIIGGGDSASAAEKCGQNVRMSHVSTGGGASLELLEGKELPGITCLDDK